MACTYMYTVHVTYTLTERLMALLMKSALHVSQSPFTDSIANLILTDERTSLSLEAPVTLRN